MAKKNYTKEELQTKTVFQLRDIAKKAGVEDASYLSEEEQPVPQGLFGQRLMRRLDQAGMEDGNEEDSELKYLEIIRTIRDTQPELYSRLEHLPRKARAGREAKARAPSTLIIFKEGQV